MADDGDSPKIHIDEDWKTQVQAEKEALARASHGTAEPAAPNPAAETPANTESTSGPAASARPARSAPLPEASLLMLISMLATQATISLGGMADPITGKATVDFDQARHMIDLLQVIEDKTQGNRTPQESALLTRLLSELRLSYLALKEESAAASTQ